MAKKSKAKKNCCPRVRLVCKKVGAKTVSQPYYELKGPLNKPKLRKASAHVAGRVKCAIVLGKKAVTPLRDVSANFGPTVDRMQRILKARGCETKGLDDSRGPGSLNVGQSITIKGNHPSVVLSKLKARAESLRGK